MLVMIILEHLEWCMRHDHLILIYMHSKRLAQSVSFGLTEAIASIGHESNRYTEFAIVICETLKSFYS